MRVVVVGTLLLSSFAVVGCMGPGEAQTHPTQDIDMGFPFDLASAPLGPPPMFGPTVSSAWGMNGVR